MEVCFKEVPFVCTGRAPESGDGLEGPAKLNTAPRKHPFDLNREEGTV